MLCSLVSSGYGGALMSPRPSEKRSLLDHLVGANNQFRRNLETKRFSGLEVDGKREFGGLLYGKIRRLGAFQNLIDVDCPRANRNTIENSMANTRRRKSCHSDQK
jgi:hypothetical protein